METNNLIINCLIIVGVIGVLLYNLAPTNILNEGNNIVKIRVSKLKSLGLFIILAFMPGLLTFITLKLNLTYNDFLVVIVLVFLMGISLTSLIILVVYFINDFYRELTIDLNNNILFVKTRYESKVISYNSKTKFRRVSGKWHSFTNPINLFEYIMIEDSLVITNLSVNLDALIVLMEIKNVKEVKKWLTFIRK
jgi:hypothetical protein